MFARGFGFQVSALMIIVAWLARKRDTIPTDEEIQQRYAYTERTLERAKQIEIKEVSLTTPYPIFLPPR